ncbi:hypothetical protein OROHE_010389 [Orobanche hederae]
MAIPVIDFSKLSGEERAKLWLRLLTAVKSGDSFNLINHGISDELLERVKTVAAECYNTEREPHFKLLKELMEK